MEGISSSELNEEWRDVKGFEGWYKISNLGRLKALKKVVNTHGKIVAIDKEVILSPNTRGRDRLYKSFRLQKGDTRRIASIHRLVAEAFIPNPNGLPIVDHINRDKTDNRAINLRWCDNFENRRNCDYNLFFTINGKTKILEDWCREYGIGRSTVKFRLNKGMDIISALTNPIMTPREAKLCRTKE